MVGHKLGEFSPTRQFSGHTPADKKAAQSAVTASPSGAATSSKPSTSASTASKTVADKPKPGASDGKK